MKIEEPLPEECTAKKVLHEDEYRISIAAWYPQVDGYFSKAVVRIDRDEDGCFDVHLWPDEKPPTSAHHCSAQQFIDFGNFIKSFQNQGDS